MYRKAIYIFGSSCSILSEGMQYRGLKKLLNTYNPLSITIKLGLKEKLFWRGKLYLKAIF